MFAGLFALLLSSCHDEKKGDPILSPNASVFILNEGSMSGNNASITLYDPAGETTVADIYRAQNGRQLGELAQNILAYDSELFVTVSGSRLICRLGNDGKEKGRLSMAPHGDPRYLAAKDGKLYVTVYGTPGRVFRLNAATLTIEDSVVVGNNPENIVLSGSKLYVSNAAYGAGETISVIDVASFTVTQTVPVRKNPNDLLAHGPAVYVISWGENWDAFDLQQIDTSSLAVRVITKANKMAAYRNKLYMAYSTTDWGSGETTTTFSTYDPATDQIGSGNFITGDALSNKTVYMLNIHPVSGQTYISTTDYETNGSVYVFQDGQLTGSFTSGGINPTKAVFVNK